MKIKRTLCGLLSVLLCLSLVIGMVPMIALADSTTVTATGKGSCTGHSHAEATALTQADIDAQITSKSKVELANNTFYLTESVDVSAVIYLVGSAHLCLNGQTITFTNANGVVSVYKGATASICDCQGGGTITRTNGVSSGNAIVYVAAATLDLYGGIISGNSSCTGNGGGIKADAGTTNMHGGWITGNTASGSLGGAGVFVNTSGTFNMSGGYISGNSTGKNGAGVYSRGNFEMTGGHIFENSITSATGHGGGVYNNNSFTLDGGNIHHNESAHTANKNNGGGVYNNSSFTMKSGNIYSNTASYMGGGVYNASSFQMDNGSIYSNESPNGGGIANDGTFTMNNGQIYQNNGTGDTGAVRVAAGTFTMKDGSITNNQSSGSNPGGVKVLNAGKFVMTGGEISSNFSSDIKVINTGSATISGDSVVASFWLLNNASHQTSAEVKDLASGASITFNASCAKAAITVNAEDETIHKTDSGIFYNLACDTQARMVLGSSLNIQFKLPTALASADVKVNGEAATAVDGIVTVYRNPAQMAEDIVLTIGDYTYTDSVQDYAERQIAKEGVAQNLKNVLIDMLNYGAAAQTAYPGYTTATTLPNANLNDSSTTVVPQYETKNPGKASLILSDSIALRVGVTAAENTPATYTFTSWDGEEYTVTTRVQKDEKGVLYVLADKIAVADAFEMVTVKVGTETVSDSVAAYCARQNGELYTALLKFAAAAQAYLAA